MRFKAKKSYGNYKTITCPFCTRIATQKNEQGLEVCHLHTKNNLEEIRCTCGSWLEQRNGKFGAYFNCLNCGNFNFQKGMEIKAITMKKENKPSLPSEPKAKQNQSFSSQTSFSKPVKERKEITITSEDVEYFS